MTNRSYCRFRNTLEDLRDCYDHLNDNVDKISVEEQRARMELINLCRSIWSETVDEEMP